MIDIMSLALIDLEEAYKGNLELGYTKDEALKVSLNDITELYSLTRGQCKQLEEQLEGI